MIQDDPQWETTMRMHNPAHPGKIVGKTLGKILANYLAGRSVTEVARHLGVPRPTLSRVLNGRAGISADMALRLAEAFHTEADFWLRLQCSATCGRPRKRNAPR